MSHSITLFVSKDSTVRASHHKYAHLLTKYSVFISVEHLVMVIPPALAEALEDTEKHFVTPTDKQT